MRVTLSVIKADVGSIGGHTKPGDTMVQACEDLLRQAKISGLLIDGIVTYTGDDLCLTMSHTHGEGSQKVHSFVWNVFKEATAVAKQYGLYGAGQDLLVDAPSGNVRGAGPGVAEIEFELMPPHRPAEAFLVFTADKCGPGAFNRALYQMFCDPMINTGLLISNILRSGFIFEIIDMDHKSKDSDRLISIDTTAPNTPHLDIITLLCDIDRYAVESIFSKAHSEKIVSVSATRLHNIAGKYTGKDDPVMIVRTQKTLPAPEENLNAFVESVVVTGDCRGSHNRPLLPVPINTPVTGAMCHPLISCLAFSMASDGTFTEEYVDMFEGFAWDEARRESLKTAKVFRNQGPFGVGFASRKELAYTGLVESEKALESKFKIRKNK